MANGIGVKGQYLSRSGSFIKCINKHNHLDFQPRVPPRTSDRPMSQFVTQKGIDHDVPPRRTSVDTSTQKHVHVDKTEKKNDSKVLSPKRPLPLLPEAALMSQPFPPPEVPERIKPGHTLYDYVDPFESHKESYVKPISSRKSSAVEFPKDISTDIRSSKYNSNEEAVSIPEEDDLDVQKTLRLIMDQLSEIQSRQSRLEEELIALKGRAYCDVAEEETPTVNIGMTTADVS